MTIILKYKSLSSGRPEMIETDYYIPISINWEYESNVLINNFYWRMRTSNDSLIEIALNSENGNLISVTLIQFNDKLERIPDISGSDNQDLEVGLPTFDISGWHHSGYVDIEEDFKIYMKSNSILISFVYSTKECRVVKNKNVIFRFDRNEILLSIEIIGILSLDMG